MTNLAEVEAAVKRAFPNGRVLTYLGEEGWLKDRAVVELSFGSEVDPYRNRVVLPKTQKAKPEAIVRMFSDWRRRTSQ